MQWSNILCGLCQTLFSIQLHTEESRKKHGKVWISGASRTYCHSMHIPSWGVKRERLIHTAHLKVTQTLLTHHRLGRHDQKLANHLSNIVSSILYIAQRNSHIDIKNKNKDSTHTWNIRNKTQKNIKLITVPTSWKFFLHLSILQVYHFIIMRDVLQFHSSVSHRIRDMYSSTANRLRSTIPTHKIGEMCLSDFCPCPSHIFAVRTHLWGLKCIHNCLKPNLACLNLQKP